MKLKNLYTRLLVFLLLFAGGVFLYLIFSFLDIGKLKDIPQSTIITDRDGKELYRFFEEDRRRVDYEDIAPTMINALVAVEDQTFRENNGTDKSGLARAVISNFKAIWHPDVQTVGGSTITQQLVKNIYLTNKKTLSRKLQELLLATELTKKLTRAFEAKGLSASSARQEAKKQIITAYANYVFFGNRSYGIQAAATNYFKTATRDLTILQSAILASLPQAPSIYNPVVKQEPILGYRTATSGGILSGMQIRINQSTSNRVLKYLSGTTTSLDHEHCLEQLISRASVGSGNEQFTYTQGRKDRALCRMFTQGYITQEELFEAFFQARTLEFTKAKYTISSPHFVFRVQKLLDTLPLFRSTHTTFEQITQGGYTIVTTLDSGLQQAAQDAMDNYATWLRGLGGNNRAMLHVKSNNGDVLTYLGSQDFFDESIDGQVDVLQSTRQVGSTLKPFFYAWLLKHFPFTIDGIILDYPIIKNGPQNHDGLARGKTTIASALAGSRNLPVVRMFYAFGESAVFIPFLKALGFIDLQEDKQYGYPLVLGSDEATLTQLAQAYMQLSTVGEYFSEINPVLRIIAPDGTIIYQKPSSRYRKVIPETVSDMIWRILSNQRNMPADRRRLRNLPVQNLALKTGTSDIKVKGKPFPRDGVSVVYGPEDVIVSWAGNTDGSAMGSKAFGGEINHYPLREYLADALASGKIIDQPRISPTPDYTEGGRYRGADGKSLTPEQEFLLWGTK